MFFFLEWNLNLARFLYHTKEIASKQVKDKFLEDLKSTEFDLPSNNVNNKDVNELRQSFKDKFTNIAERHAPTTVKRVWGLNNCPLLNTSIKRQMRQRDYLQKKAHTTELPSDWKRYRLQRNRVNNLIRKERENYDRRLINENAGDPNSFWRTVKKILLSESKEPSPKLKVDGQVITEKSSIANSFNNVFVNTAINLCKSFINAASNLSSSISLTKPTNSSFLFTNISESTVLSEILRLKSGKAVSLDNFTKTSKGRFCNGH